MIFIDWFVPAFKAGGQIQSCLNIVESLNSEFCFYIVTSDRDFGDKKPFENIILNQWVPFRKIAKIYYIGSDAFSISGIRRLLKEINPDVIYLNSMFSLKFTILPLLAGGNTDAKKILAPSGMLQDGAMQIRKFRKLLFLKVTSVFGIFNDVLFHATDSVEAVDILKQISPESKISEIPCLPGKGGDRYFQVKKKNDELRLIYLSRITEKKNLLFLLDVLESVKQPVSLDIYGEAEDDQYFAAGIRSKDRLNWHKIDFKGPVENNRIGELYTHYHVFVLPTKGENFGYAILEAFVYGKPVIISDKTPWRGLCEQKVGFDISLDKAQEYSEAINLFLRMDQTEYDVWSVNAWRFGKKVQQDEQVISKYRSLFTI